AVPAPAVPAVAATSAASSTCPRRRFRITIRAMTRSLPQLHAPRPQLVERLAAAPVAALEAPGGYGKSVLAAELSVALDVATAEALLEPGTDEAGLALDAVRRGFAAAGLTDLAAAIGDAAFTAPGDGFRSLLDAVGRGAEPVLLVVDEVGRAGSEAAELLAALARGVPEPHRALFLGRRLPAPLRRAIEERSGAFLDAGDLAFSRDDVATLLGEQPIPALVDDVVRSTVGWPAAVALVAAALRRGGDDPAAALRYGRALADLLETILTESGLDPQHVARIAHLRILDDDVVAAATAGVTLEELLHAGVPLVARGDGWLVFPERLREELAARDELPLEVARRVAAAYADRRQPAEALALLAARWDHDGLAQFLAERRWQDLAEVGLAQLAATVGLLPEDALARAPRALLQVARAAEAVVRTEDRARLLTRLAAQASGVDDPLGRELAAEEACDLARDGSDEAERRARAVLDRADGSEGVARARALQALGRLEAFRADPESLAAAEVHLGEAAALFALLGEPDWESDARVTLGYHVCFARGDLDRAAEELSAALRHLPRTGPKRATITTFAAHVETYCGRLDEAEAWLADASGIAAVVGDAHLHAYSAWERARVASHRGLAARTLEHLEDAGRRPGDWYAHPTGIEFLADAAEMLARVGEGEAAAGYAERALARAEAIGHPEIAWGARGVVAARFGDPVEAERDLAAYAASPQQPPRDAWRTLLFRAYAALRRDGSEASALAARAFEAAAALGRPELPFLHEPDVAEALVEPAVAGGATTARKREPAFAIRVLGGFAVTAGGRPADPPPGKPASLVKMLALGGPQPVDAVIEAIWPEV